MADEEQNKPFDLGFFSPSRGGAGLDPADLVALVLTLIWLVVAGLVLFLVDFGAAEPGFARVRFLLALLGVVVPVALIWVAASSAKAARIMREEAARLRAAVDAMRQSQIQQTQRAAMGVSPAFEKRLNEIAEAQKQAESVIATFATRREREKPAAPPTPPPTPVAPAKPAAEESVQPSLALGAPQDALTPPLEIAEFILALNFPEDLNDRTGFRALRRALEDRTASKLVRSAQDVLTLLSQEGIYMDDLTPDRARPEIWRRFASGERGPAVAALGGVRDQSCLALTAARMKQDPVFRDVAHHFLRQFDTVLGEFAEHATDQELNDLASTRTARAFMLLGRVTGMIG